MSLTETQWDFLWKKYGDLVYKISYKISGDDVATTDYADNVSDLKVAILDAIRGFEKQGSNGNIDNFIKSRGFDKYIKTVLWHKKASKGKVVNKKGKDVKIYSLESSGLDDEDQAFLDENSLNTSNEGLIEDNLEDQIYFKELEEILTGDSKFLIQIISSNSKAIFSSGKINKKEISRITGWNYAKINEILLFIATKIKSTL